MPTAENAKLEFEAGQTPVAYVALTDQGDQMDFKSAAALWSGRSGYAPVVRPNGLISGCAVTVDAANDKINVAAGKAYIAGVETDIDEAADQDITRGLTTDTHRINSVTITNLGAIAIVAGADHTAFSDTRGADGGPPWIPTTSIEIAQVHLTSVSAAVVTDDEIKQGADLYTEWYFSPVWNVEYADIENMVLGLAGVKFTSALDARHSDDAGSSTAGKKVYASYYTPTFSELPDAYDFVPPGNTHSISSKQVYGRTKGAKSSSIQAGSFSVELVSGVTDGMLRFVDDLLWFRFYPDRNADPYILCQGYLGASQKFPADGNIDATCSIAAETVASRVNG